MTNKLELILRMAGRQLADLQVARLFKVPEEMTQTPCDFFGYTAYGRAILVEAKMVARTALPICNDPGLQPHQWNELLDANRAGALSLIAWARGDTVAVISADVAHALSEGQGRKSIAWKDIDERYHRPFSPGAAVNLLDHWLPLPDASGSPAKPRS